MDIRLVIGIYYVCVNIILCCMMGVDKRRATRGAWRIKEAHLLWMGVVGGFLGGLLGMTIFHHKTRKIYFHLVYWFSLVLHIGVLYCLFVLLLGGNILS